VWGGGTLSLQHVFFKGGTFPNTPHSAAAVGGKSLREGKRVVHNEWSLTKITFQRRNRQHCQHPLLVGLELPKKGGRCYKIRGPEMCFELTGGFIRIRSPVWWGCLLGFRQEIGRSYETAEQYKLICLKKRNPLLTAYSGISQKD